MKSGAALTLFSLSLASALFCCCCAPEARKTTKSQNIQPATISGFALPVRYRSLPSLSLSAPSLPAHIPPCCVGTRDTLFTCWLSSRRAARTSTLPRPCRPVLAPTPILARQPTTTTKSTPNTNMRSPCLRAHRGTLSCMPMCGRALSRNRSHSCNNSVAAVASLS